MWREWQRVKEASLDGTSDAESGDGVRHGNPMPLGGAVTGDDTIAPPKVGPLKLLPTPASLTHLPPFVSDRVALVVPTSLCSSQVSQKLADRLEGALSLSTTGLSRITALPHTEGCGNSAGDSEDMFIRTILGYAVHPLVSCAVLVEHGCEKTHNSRMASVLRDMKVDPSSFGYASIQLDGGIEGAFSKTEAHIRALPAMSNERVSAPASHLRVGFVATTQVAESVARTLGAVARAVVDSGGTAVVSGTLIGANFLHALLSEAADGQSATLAYGQRAETPGLHIMHASTSHMAELMRGWVRPGWR